MPKPTTPTAPPSRSRSACPARGTRPRRSTGRCPTATASAATAESVWLYTPADVDGGDRGRVPIYIHPFDEAFVGVFAGGVGPAAFGSGPRGRRGPLRPALPGLPRRHARARGRRRATRRRADPRRRLRRLRRQQRIGPRLRRLARARRRRRRRRRVLGLRQRLTVRPSASGRWACTSWATATRRSSTAAATTNTTTSCSATSSRTPRSAARSSRTATASPTPPRTRA